MADTTGNLTQNNGSLNITGSSSSSDGVLLLGNITQTNGSLNISTVVGNLNQSSNMSIANSLQLLAGTGSAAGNTNGGNVNLGGSINANNNATLAIFSGSPNTAAYQANITGANSTGVYYKTYDASATNVTPVSATQNFYYRSAPTANVTVDNKVYDTTTNASGVVSGAVDGDTLQASGMGFDNASAGTQAVNSSALSISSANSSWVVNGYLTGAVSTNATISKANVTLADVSANNKVYDTTTNASINSTGNATVALGNSTLANGSLNTSTVFTNYTVSGAFTNASAGNNQTVNLTTVLTDSTNYTVSGGSQTTTNATISKANVFLNVPGTVSDKPYDGSTSATVTTNSSGVAQLGNSVAANGSLAANTTFGPAGVDTTGVFASPLPGQQIVNLANTLADTANYTLASGSTLITSAEILSNADAQSVTAASSSSGYLLQGLSSSGSGSSSTLSKADSAPSSTPTSASASSQGSSGSSAKEDQKSSTASTSTGTVSVTPSPGGDVPIPAVPMIALAD